MPTIPFVAQEAGPRARTLSWSPLTQTGADDGAAYSAFPFADRSIQVVGTFGAGGTLVIEGSNVPSPSVAGDWVTLTDPQGNPLSFTTARLEQVSEYTRWIRPRVTGGDGTTSLTVHMLIGA